MKEKSFKYHFKQMVEERDRREKVFSIVYEIFREAAV
jgi:hypothetical protein